MATKTKTSKAPAARTSKAPARTPKAAAPEAAAPQARSEVHMVTKSDMVSRLAQSMGIPKTRAHKAITEMEHMLHEAWHRGDTVMLASGTFHVRARAARTIRNPQTAEPLDLPAGRTVIFKPSPGLRKDLSATTQ